MEDSFINIGITYLLGITMPGPTIALVIKNALTYSRKIAITTCLGIMLGIGLQSGLVLVGLALFEQDSAIIKALKLISSLYLIYLGLKILFYYVSNNGAPNEKFYNKIIKYNDLIQGILLISLGFKIIFFCILTLKIPRTHNRKNSNAFIKNPFMEGLLLELLNPLAFSFFVSILSVMISRTDSHAIKSFYWIEIMIIGLLWFCSVAIFSSSKLITTRLKKASKLVEIVTGIIFIFFGVKLSLFV